jgi:ribosome maturation factor RimP
MRLSPLEQRVSKAIAPVVEDMGFSLVHVVMTSEGTQPILRVMAEHTVTKELNVDDCAKLSRAVGTVLDVEDIIQGAYRLELSSPGVDRPLVQPQDFVEYAGFEAKVEIDPPLPTGQKRFRGRLRGVEDDSVLLDTEEGPFELPLYAIQKAKLVVTDDLLKAGQEKRKKRIEEQQQQDQQEQA